MKKKELKLHEIKNVLLNLLVEFDTLCLQHGWKYSLAGGTCLGAIRHGGFIPWDDDIDVLMPQDDYIKMLHYFEEQKLDGSRLLLSPGFKGNFNYPYPYSKYVDMTTKIEYERYDETQLQLGLYIDIFPVTGLPKDIKSRKKHFENMRMDIHMLWLSSIKWPLGSENIKGYKRVINYLLYLVAKKREANFYRDRIVNRAFNLQFNESNYAAVSVWGYGERETMNIDDFSVYQTISFENKNVSILKMYDKYLTNLYGKYMELPPEKQRIPKHNYKAYQYT